MRERRGVAKPELVERCRLGAYRGPECAHDHVARALDKGLGGSKSLRLCPGHGGREATLSINPGREFRLIWNEQAETCDLDDRDIYSLLLTRGVDESCLGTYGLRRQGRQQSGPRIQGATPDMLADIRRYHAITKLPMDQQGHLYKMCVQAITESDGEVSSDPFKLLPDTEDLFKALGRRCGFDRAYCWKLWHQWSEKLSSLPLGA
jgi:hypothetical protein